LPRKLVTFRFSFNILFNFGFLKVFKDLKFKFSVGLIVMYLVIFVLKSLLQCSRLLLSARHVTAASVPSSHVS
jgi:hypothetical protein